MADNLFQGLPPPSAPHPPASSDHPLASANLDPPPPPPPPPVPPPALKSALKREKAPEPKDEAPQKRLRFKTTVDATETQIIEAMQKISSHIKNPSKFSKASRLTLQLIQAGSVKPGTSDHFFAILEAAMCSPSASTDPSLRGEYHTLFSAVQDVTECFNNQQKNQLRIWTLRAVVSNDLYTDDSFVYAKAAGKIKEAISSLPPATAEDDKDEAAALAETESGVVSVDNQATNATSSSASELNIEFSDPFGLDALLPSSCKKDERARGQEVAASNLQEEEEAKRFIKSQREVLVLCLEIAARRYKIPWAQTVIDILVKHAFDNIKRFTSRQRDAIEKLWASIREQHIRRKQGKSVTGKLDMNAFEYLQEKYSNEKISIRHSVGGAGDRRAQQWLG